MATITPISADTIEWKSLRVKVVNTAEYAGGFVKDRTFGMKIDVEGAEPVILNQLVGFKGLKFVVFEGDRNEEILFDLFRQSLFDVFGLKKSLLLPKVELVSHMAEWHRFHDFVAVPQLGLPRGTTLSLRSLAAAVIAQSHARPREQVLAPRRP